MKIIKEFNVRVLLLDICKWYGYNVAFGESVACNNSDFSFARPTVEDCLIEWKETLKDTNVEYLNNGEKAPFIDEIRFIRSLEFDKITNCDLGKKMIEIINTEEFYEDVCFTVIGDSLYEKIGRNLRATESGEYNTQYSAYNDFKIAHILHEDYVFDNIEDLTYDFIKAEVDNNLLIDYYFDNDKDRFVIKKTLQMARKLLDDNNIEYDFYNDEIIIETQLEKPMEIEIDDEHMYMVCYNKSTSSHFDSDQGLLDYINYHLEEDEEVVLDAKEDCSVPSLLSIRYSTSAKYKEELIPNLHLVEFVAGIPFVNTYEGVKVATGVHVSVEDDGKINILSVISNDTPHGLKYWVGATTEEVYNLIEGVIPKEEFEHIRVMEKYTGEVRKIRVSSLEEIIDIEECLDWEIQGCKFDMGNSILEASTNKYRDFTLSEYIHEIDVVLASSLGNNMDALLKLMDRGNTISALHDDIELYYYHNCDEHEAIEQFLESEKGIPHNALAYMNHFDYFHNEIGYEVMQEEDYTVIYER